MHVALICRDKPGHLEVRLSARPDHLAYLNSLGSKLAFAGPTLDADDQPDGSIIMLEVTDMAEAERIAAADPYAAAGLFQSVDLRPGIWALNAPGAAN